MFPAFTAVDVLPLTVPEPLADPITLKPPCNVVIALALAAILAVLVVILPVLAAILVVLVAILFVFVETADDTEAN